jgi:hypothetical protein
VWCVVSCVLDDRLDEVGIAWTTTHLEVSRFMAFAAAILRAFVSSGYYNRQMRFAFDTTILL